MWSQWGVHPTEGFQEWRCLKERRAAWQLLSDEKALRKRLQAGRESTKPDKEIIESVRGELNKVKAGIRNLKPAKPEIKAAV
jgi:hypothetical protein